MKKEWDKIRKLESQIGQATKAQQDMTAKMYDHRLKMEGILQQASAMEEEKKQATGQYDLKNRRGLTSQANQTASKAKPSVQSGKAIFKSKAQMAAEAEAKIFGGGTPSKEVEGDTFLTDLMMGKRPSESARSKKNAQSAVKP